MAITYYSSQLNGVYAGIIASGGTEVTSGGYKYHTFTSSGTFTVTQPGYAEVLLIGAGGGGSEGGGGAGEAKLATIVFTAGDQTITVGAGGTGSTTSQTNGEDTTVNELIAIGGGKGARKQPSVSYGQTSPAYRSGSGACGGGGATSRGAPAGGDNYLTYTGGYGFVGYQGGDAVGNAIDSGKGGGGGGMGSAGKTQADNYSGGPGGDGIATYSAWGSATSTGELSGGSYYFCGGGGGGCYNSGAGGDPGVGGGGQGRNTNDASTAGTANTGGGGGGSWAAAGKNGGSGLVIIRYAV